MAETQADRIAEIERRCRRAPGGPWYIDRGVTERLAIAEGHPEFAEPVAELIAHAPDDLRWLLTLVKPLSEPANG
jgi:hypothetical protein